MSADSSVRIPTSSHVLESTVIEAPLSKVWHHIKLENFSDFWSRLSKSEYVKGASPDTDIVKWTFKDGSTMEVKQEEHSTIHHFITYSVITSEPSISYMSQLSTIKLYEITSGKHENHTYIEWSGRFSSDAGADVIEDGKFKRREALEDLAKTVTK